MTKDGQFTHGCEVIADMYSKRINAKPYNEDQVSTILNTLRTLGFKRAKETTGSHVLYLVKGEYIQRVIIGADDAGNGVFTHEVARQETFSFVS